MGSRPTWRARREREPPRTSPTSPAGPACSSSSTPPSSRRGPMPMTREEIEAFLAEPRLCAFATVDERGLPRVRPLWYLWRDGVFWFTTRLEVRHTGRDLASSTRVAVSVASEDRPYPAVVAHGRPEVVPKDRGL